jgi:hypothetical protein
MAFICKLRVGISYLGNMARSLRSVFVNSEAQDVLLISFVGDIEVSAGVQRKLREATTVADVCLIAQGLGYRISEKYLESRVDDLAAHYWPWFGRKRAKSNAK